MINIASIPPASWPTSATAATAVAPVAAVGAVSPSSRSGREDASAFGSGSGRQAPLAQDASAGKGVNREASADAPKAAPILPEKAKAGESSSVAQALEEAKEAEKAAQEAEAVQAERATQREKLLEVLSTVWKASAAVVDNALGRGDRAAAAQVAPVGDAGAGAAPVVVAAAVRSGAETAGPTRFCAARVGAGRRISPCLPAHRTARFLHRAWREPVGLTGTGTAGEQAGLNRAGSSKV
ncbi:MAG: hypothetical protein R3E56_01505 [Burkholderiaceae bacterium]